MFHGWGKKEKNKTSLQMILCEQCAFAESLMCAKSVYFWYVSFNYQQSKSEKRQPSPNNLLQRRCPSAESPAPWDDLPSFMAGHKGTQPFYLNLFWENCLLDAGFQQPLPSEKNIHGWCFTSNANRIKSNPPTLYISDLFHTYSWPFT